MSSGTLTNLIMELAALVQRQRAFFQSGATRPLAFRRAALQKLAAALETHEAALLAALKADLGKSPYQSLGSELAKACPKGRKRVPRSSTP